MDNQTIAYTQLSYIISRMEPKIKRRIPENVRKSISKKKDNTYIFKYDNSKSLYEQNILNETKDMLSVLYSDYICSDDKKEVWKEIDRLQKYRNMQNEEREAIKKYNLDDIFKNSKNKEEDLQKNFAIEKVHKKNFIQKLMDFVRTIFNMMLGK